MLETKIRQAINRIKKDHMTNIIATKFVWEQLNVNFFGFFGLFTLSLSDREL